MLIDNGFFALLRKLTNFKKIILKVDESEDKMKDIRVSWTYAEDTLGSTILKVNINISEYPGHMLKIL